MEYMATLPDKFFDLAIVDPPYGIGAEKGTEVYLKNEKWKTDRKQNAKTIYGEWDNSKPDKMYFDELLRVSKNQIIWGGNYFNLPPSQWIVWDKLNGESFFADGEMAWTSFSGKMRIFKYLSCGFMGSHKNREERIHPTQKPVALYLWLLKNYAKPGDKIFDSHMGSQSSRIACHKMGFDFWGCELDKEYFESGCKRYENEIKQGRLF
jgi:site-specific DNA-methyltransferase (adenine-specific)